MDLSFIYFLDALVDEVDEEVLVVSWLETLLVLDPLDDLCVGGTRRVDGLLNSGVELVDRFIHFIFCEWQNTTVRD